MDKRNESKSANQQDDTKHQSDAKAAKDDEQTPVIQDLASI